MGVKRHRRIFLLEQQSLHFLIFRQYRGVNGLESDWIHVESESQLVKEIGFKLGFRSKSFLPYRDTISGLGYSCKKKL